MKQLLLIILFAAMACGAHAQTSSVTVNSAGKIVVPANGTLTSPGTITANNVTSNGTLTAGNLTTAGAVGAKNITITRNGTASLLFSGDGSEGSSGNATSGAYIDLAYNGANNRQMSFGDLALRDSNTGTFIALGFFGASGPPIFTAKYHNGGAAANLGFCANTESIQIGYPSAVSPSGQPRVTIRERVNDDSVPILRLANSQANGGNLDLYVDNTTGGKVRFVSSGANKSYTFDAPVAVGTSGTLMTGVFSASASIDFASTSAQTTNSGNTITVTGATTTNTPSVQIGLSAALPTGCSLHGIVTGSNTVTLYFVNASASAQDPGAITVRATATGF